MTTLLHDLVSPHFTDDALRTASRIPCNWDVRARQAFGGGTFRFQTLDVSLEGIQLRGRPSWLPGTWLVLEVETPHGTAGVEARVVRVCPESATWAVRFDGLDRSGVRLMMDLLERDSL